MANLETSVQEVDSAVSSMYSEPDLNRLEYRLHAVMVHEGSVNSGHYWAYVFDSRRDVWLKFNDNSVSEATWEELQKESVGGHSNASAYSLVYLRSSKSEMLMTSSSDQEQSNNASGTSITSCLLFSPAYDLTERRLLAATENMEQGGVDQLINSLPNDLAEQVAEDNKRFRDERTKWDLEQEEKKKQEALAEAKAQAQKESQTDSNGECQVGTFDWLLHVRDLPVLHCQ